MQHLRPKDDGRGHVTDGSPCPCLPRTVDGVIVHNSFDGQEVGTVFRGALDRLTARLSAVGVTIDPSEQQWVDHAYHLLLVHWPDA